jgi:hypothetical protein
MSELRGSATLTASSEYSGSFLKGNAVDGNTSTNWASASQGASSYLTFTWGSSVTLREIRLICRPSDAWSFPRFTFADATYADGYTHLAADADVTYVLRKPVTTTSVKIGIAPQSYSGSNCGFKEVYINDAYTVAPSSTDLTIPEWLTVSSAYSSDYANWGKQRVIDGNTATDWAVNGDGSAAWIQWNWNSNVRVDSVQLRDRGADRWGTPRFTFDDASTQDGSGAISNSGFTTYTLTPKTTKTLKVSIASGGSGSNRGLAEAVITGALNPSGGGAGARSFVLIV